MCLYNYMYIDCRYLSKNMTILVKLLSGVRLFAAPWTVAHQALPSMGFFQARVLESVAISFSRELPNPGMETRSPTLQADTWLSEPPGKAWLSYSDVTWATFNYYSQIFLEALWSFLVKSISFKIMIVVFDSMNELKVAIFAFLLIEFNRV